MSYESLLISEKIYRSHSPLLPVSVRVPLENYHLGPVLKSSPQFQSSSPVRCVTEPSRTKSPRLPGLSQPCPRSDPSPSRNEDRSPPRSIFSINCWRQSRNSTMPASNFVSQISLNQFPWIRKIRIRHWFLSLQLEFDLLDQSLEEGHSLFQQGSVHLIVI